MNLTKAFITLLIILTSGLVNKSHAQFHHGQTVYFVSPAGEIDLSLAPQNRATTQRTPIVVHPRTDSYENASKWRLENAGGGWFYIRNIQSNLVLNIKDGRSQPGTGLWLWPQNGSDAQKFKFHPFDRDPALYLIESKLGADIRIDLANSIPTSGSKAIINRELQGRRAQKWKIAVHGAPDPYDLRIPKSTFTGVTQPVFKQFDVRLSNHGNGHLDKNGKFSWLNESHSFIRLDGHYQRFTLPQYTGAPGDRQSYINDMKLERVRTRFLSNNFLSLNIKFEEEGHEIKAYCTNCPKGREDNGAPDFHITNNSWEILLRLVPYNKSISYEVQTVQFLGEISGPEKLTKNILQTSLVPVFEREIRRFFAEKKKILAYTTRQKAEKISLDFKEVTGISFDGNYMIIHRR